MEKECKNCKFVCVRYDESAFCDLTLPPWLESIVHADMSRDVQSSDTCIFFEWQQR